MHVLTHDARGYALQAEWHSCVVAVKMLKRSDEIAMNDFRTELDVLQKVVRSAALVATKHSGGVIPSFALSPGFDASHAHLQLHVPYREY